jgi:predicted PurR-regulated permease PerM
MSPPELPPAAPSRIPQRWQRPLFFGICLAVVVWVVVAASAVMLPFVLALVIAYVLTPLVAWVEKRRVPRGAAILTVYVAVLGSMSLFITAIAPRVGFELGGLRREIPAMVAEAQSKWVPALQDRLRTFGIAQPTQPSEPVPVPAPAIVARPQADGSLAIDVGNGFAVVPAKSGYLIEPIRTRKDEAFDLNETVSEAIGKSLSYVQHNALELARIGRDIVLGVSRAVFIFGITLMLAAYLMITREKIMVFFASLVRPTKRPDFARLLARIDLGLAGVVRGQLIICLINGGLSAVGFAIVGLKYWPVLAIVSTVFSLIPIFGSIASAVPAVALGLTQSLGTASFVLIWIIGIHQLEANFLNPKIMGDAAKIHPVLVIFSLLAGEHFFHTVGALLAVPTMSIAQSLFLHVRESIHRSDPEFAAELAPSSIPPNPKSRH